MGDIENASIEKGIPHIEKPQLKTLHLGELDVTVADFNQCLMGLYIVARNDRDKEKMYGTLGSIFVFLRCLMCLFAHTQCNECDQG